MVIVLKGRERPTNEVYFDQLFRIRHEVFIKRRGWALPSLNGREIDQYDCDDTVYLLDVNDDDVIEASVRVNPSVSGSLLADYFPHLVENGAPIRSADIYEATRLIVTPQQKSRSAIRDVRARLLGALVEWGINQGLTFMQTVIETSTLSSYVEMTPLVMPLGLSHPYGGGRESPGGGECLAIRWPLTQQVLDDIHIYATQDTMHVPWIEAGRSGEISAALH
jgi:acyl-homoserine lactone synthase